MISPIATTLLNLWPLPNQFGGANEETNYANDYVAEEPQINQSTQFNQRIDWTQSRRSNIFGRYSWENDVNIPVSVFGNLTAQVTNTTVKQAVIGNTFVINQHMVNDARIAWDHFYNSTAGPFANGSFDPQASLGIAGLNAVNAEDYGYPSVGVTGFTGYGGNVALYHSRQPIPIFG